MAKYFASATDAVSKRELDHMNTVRKFAGECMVLLENDGTLPLKAASGNVALFGNGARNTIKGGTGSGDVNSRKVITFEEGLEDAGFTVTTKKWLDAYEEIVKANKAKYSKKIKEMAEEEDKPEIIVSFGNPMIDPAIQEINKKDIEASDSELAIYVLARNSGEGSDRYNNKGDYLLNDEEIKAIKLLGQEYETLIVVLNVANVIDTTQLLNIPGINAILLAGQLGNIGGYAFADVLLGKSIPSGKLVDTWAKNYEDYPCADTFSHNNGNVDDEYYEEGIYVGYRYFDTFNITPNYCFGYGKTYTTFDIETTDVCANEEKVTLTVKVTNTGDTYKGKEVVQVYASSPAGNLEKPYQELVTFEKTDFLEPGQSQNLNISFETTSMASYSEEKAAWILEEGEYIIRVGNSSRNTKIEAVLSLTDNVIVEQLKNLFKDSDPVEEFSRKDAETYSYKGEDAEKKSAAKIELDSNKFETTKIEYQDGFKEFPKYEGEEKLTVADVKSGKATLQDLVSQLSVYEMAAVCTGTARIGVAGSTSVIGSASIQVPGAAGDTTSILFEDREITNIILADGPAGLRLTPHFAVDKDDNILPGGAIYGDMLFEEVEKKEDATDYYQYCTAIPVATTLSQSWDLDLIQSLGEVVGKEMKEFNVTLWLAPGMNIHRNPLCGRNFEYYSEDPHLTGMCAVAATKGVQSYEGIGTTIKHFAANNNEDNRMFINTHVSERALREIYLKGFEIAVKTSEPMSIMSSYNLINGIHAANNYDLLTAVARDEWDFDGFVMTDWLTSDDISYLFRFSDKYDKSSTVECISAGNDLQMPGNGEIVDDIVEAVNETGKLSLGELQICTYRILKIVLASQYYEDSVPYAETLIK